jgi:hypothetical protein
MPLLSRIRGHVARPKPKKNPADYRASYREVSQAEPGQTQSFIHFPFPSGSPEAAELQSTIWKIESNSWRQFLLHLAGSA